MWTYFSFRAASAAPATANRLDDIRSALVRPGVASKAAARLMAADHRRHNCNCARTDRGAYRAANKSARQSAGAGPLTGPVRIPAGFRSCRRRRFAGNADESDIKEEFPSWRWPIKR
jgi:hypothetical protein